MSRVDVLYFAIFLSCLTIIVLEIVFFKIPPAGHIQVISQNLTNNRMLYLNLTSGQLQTAYFKSNAAMNDFVWKVNGPFSLPLWVTIIITAPILLGTAIGMLLFLKWRKVVQ